MPSLHLEQNHRRARIPLRGTVWIAQTSEGVVTIYASNDALPALATIHPAGGHWVIEPLIPSSVRVDGAIVVDRCLLVDQARIEIGATRIRFEADDRAAMVRFRCPHCGKPLKAEQRLRGRTARCKGCHQEVIVPQEASSIPDVPGSGLAPSVETPMASFDQRWSQTVTPPAPPTRFAAQGSINGGQPVADDARAALIPPPIYVPPSQPKLPVRIRRLVADAQHMERAFQGFPFIRIRSATGNPSELYQVEYFVRGLARGLGGAPVYRDQHLVEIQLTREYPRQSPKCRMLTPIFHPNIEPAVICVGDHWTAAERLVDLVIRIGEMIMYQAYNIKSPLDGEAAMWADLNRMQLPIDPRDLRLPGLD